MNVSDMARSIRELILSNSYRARVGHIGSCLSVVDIIAALYAPEGGILRIDNPHDPGRDRFVLSKGHASLALYAALYLRNWISADDLATFCDPGSKLYTHPNHEVTGIDFSTGSLGMGITFAVGAALAGKKLGDGRRVYALISDAELNEGSTWEAIMFAAHHRLNNLMIYVDMNGQQALGYTHDVCSIPNPAERFRAFGWLAADVRDPGDIAIVTHSSNGLRDKPAALVVHTTFGDGVSFMERQIKWHYSPMTEAEYHSAMAEVLR